MENIMSAWGDQATPQDEGNEFHFHNEILSRLETMDEVFTYESLSKFDDTSKKNIYSSLVAYCMNSTNLEGKWESIQQLIQKEYMQGALINAHEIIDSTSKSEKFKREAHQKINTLQERIIHLPENHEILKYDTLILAMQFILNLSFTNREYIKYKTILHFIFFFINKISFSLIQF